MAELVGAACLQDVALDVLRKYRDFVTRVVCCYSTDTESNVGDDDAAARQQELVELLPPAEGDADRGGGGAGRTHRAGDASWRSYGGSSDDGSDGGSDDASGGAMMRPAAPPVPRGAPSQVVHESPAQEIVRRLRSRPERRHKALVRALTGDPPDDAQYTAQQRSYELPGGATLQEAATQPAAFAGFEQATLVPLYAPGASG